MKNNKHTIIEFLPALLSFLLTLGTMTVFHACGIREDGTRMNCHQAQIIVSVIGAVLTVILSLSVFSANKKVKLITLPAGAAAAVFAFLVPGTIIPMCMMKTMRCYTVMQPFVRVMTALLTCLCLFRTYQELKQ